MILKLMLTAQFHLGNASKYLSVNNMKKTKLCGYFYNFSVDYDSIDVNDVSDIHEYLMKKQYKIIFRLYKQVFITLLSFSESLPSMANVNVNLLIESYYMYL